MLISYHLQMHLVSGNCQTIFCVRQNLSEFGKMNMITHENKIKNIFVYIVPRLQQNHRDVSADPQLSSNDMILNNFNQCHIQSLDMNMVRRIIVDKKLYHIHRDGNAVSLSTHIFRTHMKLQTWTRMNHTNIFFAIYHFSVIEFLNSTTHFAFSSILF
eukprot:190640_1